MAMISLTFRDTYLQTDFYARGAADTAYLTFGILFAFCGLLSYVAHQCSESASRRSVYAGMGTVFLFIGITMGILLPNRLTITFKDFNGRPVDFANHFDQLMTTPILIHIIGEITNQRALAGACASWNHPVYIFGFLSSITDQGLSAFLAWCAVGTYSVMLHYMEAMFANSTKSNQGANMNEYALYFAKICAYGGGHLGI